MKLALGKEALHVNGYGRHGINSLSVTTVKYGVSPLLGMPECQPTLRAECALPSLSSLLENPRINPSDTFVLCIQIYTPVGPQFPQHPSAFYVPRDLLQGIEDSLDNPRTLTLNLLSTYTNVLLDRYWRCALHLY